MNPRAWTTARDALGLLVMAASLGLLAGCLIIPVDYHAAGSRRNINPKTAGSFELGVTTKMEVLLAFGEPDFVSEDGERLGYAWSKVKAVWVVVGNSSAAGGEIQRSYVLEASFDASNRASRVRLLKEWGQAVTPNRELEAPH